MIGDKLILKPYHYPPAREIFSLIKEKINQKEPSIYLMSIGGESGCGKSTLSIALKEIFAEQGIKCFILHMDDYFHLPPTSNHFQRLEDINHVGPQEVDLDLLQNHINRIESGEKEIIKPLIHYKENDKRTEIFTTGDKDVVIIEGTYVSQLDNIDSRIFMSRTYQDTRENRINRARDPISPFIEDVLQIEHTIIKKHLELADILVDIDYNIKVL